MAVRTRHDLFPVETAIQTEHIVPTSRLVSNITGFAVQPNKAIVGANAFAHEAGIHQDGVLKHRETYEIMRAQDVGWGENRLVLGKHSGRAAFKARLDALGHQFNADDTLAADELNSLFASFKDLADKKHEVFDEDLQALLTDAGTTAEDELKLVSLESHSKLGEKPTSSLILNLHGEDQSASSEGAGPVDAAFQAIESVVNSGAELTLYSVNNITQGTDAQGEVTVRLQRNGQIVNGSGSDTDIIVASAKAYVNAFNMLNAGVRAHPQQEGV
jgi:2-isopropylmalate synthase